MNTQSKPQAGKPVPIHIGDDEYFLRFSLRTLKLLEQEQQIALLEGDQMVDVLRKPERMAVVLYYGLRASQPSITLDWVEDNVDASLLMTELAPKLAFAVTGRMPDMSRILGESPNGQTPDGTGSQSGPSGDMT